MVGWLVHESILSDTSSNAYHGLGMPNSLIVIGCGEYQGDLFTLRSALRVLDVQENMHGLPMIFADGEIDQPGCDVVLVGDIARSELINCETMADYRCFVIPIVFQDTEYTWYLSQLCRCAQTGGLMRSIVEDWLKK